MKLYFDSEQATPTLFEKFEQKMAQGKYYVTDDESSFLAKPLAYINRKLEDKNYYVYVDTSDMNGEVWAFHPEYKVFTRVASFKIMEVE